MTLVSRRHVRNLTSFMLVVLLILCGFSGGLALNAKVVTDNKSINPSGSLYNTSGKTSPIIHNMGIEQTVVLPQFPFWDNPTIEINETFISQLALDYCINAGENASGVEFFLGHLPMWSADELCHTSEKSQIGELFGNLYLSGYFGGVWLRDALSSNNTNSKDISEVLMKLMPNALGVEMETKSDKLIFYALTCFAGGLIDIALQGRNITIFIVNQFSIKTFLRFYGYNWGYLNFILENPPNGTIPPDDIIIFNRFLDCQMPGVEFESLNQYKSVLDKLYNPPTWKWLKIRIMLETWGKGSVSAGQDVWENIMDNSELPSSVYNLLLDLSARFLLVSELTLLSMMKGYAECDYYAGKCGILQEVGMTIWATSYFMGLTSDLPEGTFPKLECP
jgi:hypothetical protein